MYLINFSPAVEMRSPEHPADDIKSRLVTILGMLRPEAAAQDLQTGTQVRDEVDVLGL